ncbi:MAG TPA: O-antigen ligase family protein [Pyrinomonadaceae bacterium]|nr:O-antigen ligase family protein [Pyrinomonadaceae bacterium]
MSQVTTAETMPGAQEETFKLRLARVLGILVFAGLLALLVITAIPYGTAEAWWKAFFICAAFSLAVLWLIEGYLTGAWITEGSSIILPLVALVLFCFLQTIPLGNQAGGTRWLSADQFETRFFALQVSALILCGLFLFRYISSPGRLLLVINFVIVIAVASAIFGVIRQTTQHGVGFGLPLLKPDQGYGQFINRNHFAFLMEMALGLALGMILGGGVKRDQVLLYLAALIPVWTALVLCSSRGGLIAMMAQVIVAAFLVSGFLQSRRGVPGTNAPESTSKVLRLLRSSPVRIALFLVLVCGVVFGTLYLGGEQLATRIEQSRTELAGDTAELNQGVKRNETWAMTLKMFAAHPILGVGMGAYWVAVPAFHNASGTLTPQEAHNDYLELLASGGLVGLGIAIWFFVAVAKKAKANLGSPNRLRRAACLGACIGIAGVAVHSLVDFGLHMLINALVFTTLIVIATSEQPWDTEVIHET